MSLKQTFQNKATYLYLGIILILIYLSPFLIYGEDIYLVQYDNLDSVIVWFKILTESGLAFSQNDAIIPNMMNGLPRVSYASEFSVLFLLYNTFEPFVAYVINEFLVHIVAFLGMFLLIQKYFITQQSLRWRYFYIFIPSILFALIPFWTHGGLSVAGQPLALYAFLSIRDKQYTLIHWMILALVPFYSSLILGFIFFLFAMGILWVYDIIHEKKVNWHFFIALVFMSIIYLVLEYRLLYEMFIEQSFISHRIEFDLRHNFTFDAFYKKAHIRFLNGTANNITLQYLYILPFIFITMLVSFSKRKLSINESFLLLLTVTLLYIFNGWAWLLASKYSLPLLLLFGLTSYLLHSRKILPFLLIIQIIIAYWAEFWQSPWWSQFYDTLPLIKSFHFSRLIFISVTIWYIMLALSIHTFIKKVKISWLWLLLLLIGQIYHSYTWKTFSATERSNKKMYKKYYSTELFDEIEHYIGKEKDSYRIVSLGLEPAISLYNGFYTIDGYSTNYPLSYKHDFRKIMRKYLNTISPHKGDKHMYDDWGSKVYLMQSNMPSVSPNSNRIRSASNIHIDTQLLYCMGASYIFSAYEIEDSKDIALEKLKEFTNKETSIWTVTLYKIIFDTSKGQNCENILLSSSPFQTI